MASRLQHPLTLCPSRDSIPLIASAKALTDYKLLRINHSTFDHMVQENPEIAVRMLRKLSRRLRDRQEADLRADKIARGSWCLRRRLAGAI